MFLVYKDGTVWDPDMVLLFEIAEVLDRHSGAIHVDWEAIDGRPETDHFDRWEHLAGLGFVACQRYLISTAGFLNTQKATALAAGPCHATGKSVVEVVNAAANYWKHRDEWHLENNPGRREKIAAAFDALGFSIDGEYPLSGILAELSVPEMASFEAIVRKLESWREDLRGGTAQPAVGAGRGSPGL